MRLKQNHIIFLVLLSPLLLLAFLGDLVIYFFTSDKGCVQCGIDDIVKEGVFVRSINSFIGIHGSR
ncbi:hypothetical protein COU89_03635 [Candidatus Roizmanbacteria bacterium CG10_big_fil_rev_8_21_14_0_10_45_7]|uniref:Uncharacterized protein n=1 Tax=Candidatus Roizmanbacteria bacterium CG10_big_fil_rev_8_21_14_0_10_45_7 TaxID=1974854 RepID=A0A2M8KTY2_9BACT|nr:MAG: hypothetical protein COU89_03635 [Candidatus Roizmanbacteria bacterium CG10_big_fil_rev_8_21_14_0_10_45_7]